jgi:hypothetical protein
MTLAVLIDEIKDSIRQINVDIDPSKNEIFKILGGCQTFIGQWPEIDVVIMKAENALIINENTLPEPFEKEETYGKILLLRMDENSEPQDFTLEEYKLFGGWDERHPI